eukprot:1175883-Prorocentrum_minimum.AAC.4
MRWVTCDGAIKHSAFRAAGFPVRQNPRQKTIVIVDSSDITHISKKAREVPARHQLLARFLIAKDLGRLSNLQPSFDSVLNWEKMPPKKEEVVPDEEPEPEIVDPPSGTDFYRYLEKPELTYEGSYDTFDPNPPPKENDDEKGKKDTKAKGKKGDVSPEPETPHVPPRLVRSGEGNYSDGSIQCSGGWDKDIVHGTATIKYQSGAVYEGGWNQGKYSGHGKYTWADGSWYEGSWYNNFFHGQGKYYNATRNQTYEGQYYNGAGPGLYSQV